MLSLKNIYTTLKNVIIIVIAILCTVGMTTFVSLIKSAMANPPTFTVGTESIINIQNSGTALNLGDDSMSGMKDIGFDFTFYDQTFDQVNISMNGFFTFQSNFSIPRNRNYLSEVIPATSFNYSVFPLWTDLINRNGTQNPYIQTFGNTSDTDQYFVIGWYNAKEYSNQLQNTFEAILYEGTNQIEFRYDKIQIRTHDITIGVQGNNEATTYLRYEDTNAKQYMQTDDFSITTAEVIDESFSNLSSECLVDADFSELCNVYDLTNDFEEEDYLYGAGLTDSMLFGYDEEEDFYGFHEDETNLYGREVVFEDVSYGHIGSDDYDATISITDIIFVEEYYLEDEHISLDDDFNFTDDSFVPDLENIDFIPLEDITDTEVIDIFEIHIIDREEEFIIFIEEEITEEEMQEMQEHFEEHFEEEFEEEREQFAETEETFEEQEEEIIEEEEDIIEEESIEAEEEEIQEDRPRRSSRARSIIASTNTLLSNVNATVNRSISSSTSNNAVTSNIGSTGSTASVSPSSTTNSPSISDQIASSQAQTNTVLQSINITPMPTVGDSPAVVMAEVQITSIDNQIESMTSTMVSASEADQIADEIVANNIRAQQEESQQQQEETGEYDTQGQATLIAYMNYVPNFTSYTEYSIPDQTTWYEPTVIYADAMLRDNASAFSGLVISSSDKLYNMMGQQPLGIFNGR